MEFTHVQLLISVSKNLVHDDFTQPLINKEKKGLIWYRRQVETLCMDAWYIGRFPHVVTPAVFLEGRLPSRNLV
jgi:hypothetical protein